MKEKMEVKYYIASEFYAGIMGFAFASAWFSFPRFETWGYIGLFAFFLGLFLWAVKIKVKYLNSLVGNKECYYE